jgi:hypothetical protein
MARFALRDVLVSLSLVVLWSCARGPAVCAQSAATPAAVGPEVRWVQSAACNAEAKFHAELESQTTMDFEETPLQDVVDYLKDYHGIQIELDTKALEDARIGSDTPVTRRLKGISLRSALHLVLAPLEMTFVVRDDVVLLTTQEAARRMIELRIYSVSDLAETDEEADDLADVLQSQLGQTSQLCAYRKLLLVRGPTPVQEELLRILTDMRQKIQEPK